MSSSSRQNFPIIAPNEHLELEDHDDRGLETSSEDEFTDAREAMTSPTRPLANSEHTEASGGRIRNNPSGKLDSTSDQIQEGESSPKAEDKAPNFTSRIPAMKVDLDTADEDFSGTRSAELDSIDAKPDAEELPEDVPSTEDSTTLKVTKIHDHVKSPIAPDGGFGPMNQLKDPEPEPQRNVEEFDQIENASYEHEDFGDDFDDFAEEDKLDDDFGDFGNGFESEDTKPVSTSQPSISPELPYPLLDFSNSDPSLELLEEMISPHLDVLYPDAKRTGQVEALRPLPEGKSAFLSERSHSLWEQLIAPSPLQPPNWVRSRIRRLFLVSLGVPVDLDEILPKSQQKKLVLPYNPADSASKTGAKVKESKTTSVGTDQPNNRRRGPPPPPEFDIDEVKNLCQKTEADLEEMSDVALQTHVTRLEELSEVGKAVLMYWVERKQFAVDEKEAFDSVVESLVRHARRVRK